ncbi:50S ribosomal protein L9 [Thermopetrobacter sp. TC1]|uniref:50S ribosomal protein L9 n=1 Tax=Thermopetrobacter sp. TC1 TaxID=1495045 RepID=UPI00057147C4|nr:50S ribosomal protein L9 [Thermopetrobacter sp. TC1]
MQVILLERIEKLGNMGDVVTVKDGYARNFLLPQGKALRATKANLERFEREREELERKNAEARAAAEKDAEKIEGAKLVLIRQAGEMGQLYGSVTTRDIANALKEEFGVEVVRNQVQLDRPIKIIGLHDVIVRLHPEVSVTVTLNVARNEDEAELQAKGEILVGSAAEREEAREAAEAMLAEIEAAKAEAEAEAEAKAEGESEAETAGETDEAEKEA